VYRTTGNDALRIYTTTTPTTNRLYTLMHDPIYRMSVATENVATTNRRSRNLHRSQHDAPGNEAEHQILRRNPATGGTPATGGAGGTTGSPGGTTVTGGTTAAAVRPVDRQGPRAARRSLAARLLPAVRAVDRREPRAARRPLLAAQPAAP